MARRIRKALCALVGHRPARSVEGVYEGYFMRALICPRCHHIYASEVGSRKVRRARWRERGMA